VSRFENVQQHLNRLRMGYVRNRTALFAQGTLAALLTLFLVFTLLDLAFHLPTFLCWLSWLFLLALIGTGAWFVRRTLRQEISQDAMAVLIERVLPQLKNHLINAVQLTEDYPKAGLFIDALLSEADLGVENVQPQHLYSQKPALWVRRGLAGMGIVIAVLFAVTPRGMGHAAARLFLPMAGVEPYTLTRLDDVTPGDTTVLRGNSLDVSAAFAGVAPKDASVIWDRGGGRTETLLLHQPDAPQGAQPTPPNRYSAQLQGVFNDCRYRVVGGDARTRWFTVTVTNPPGLQSWEAKVTPPEYTARPAYPLRPGDKRLDVPAGSTLVLAAVANCELRSVQFMQDDKPLVQKDIDSKTKFAAKFDVRDGGAVKLRLSATSGLETVESLPFVIVLDQKPVVLLLEARQRIVAAKDAQVPLAFRAEDDYAVQRVGLERLINDESQEKVEPVTAAQPEKPQKQFAARFLVDLATFGAKEGDTLKFRLWAEDNGPTPDKRRGYSSVVQIAIPAAEERREAKEKVAEQTQKTLLTLIKMQRDTLATTRQIADIAAAKPKQVTPAQIQDSQLAQKSVRALAADLLQTRAALGDLATVLTGLLNHEMVEVLNAFEEAHQAGEKDLGTKLTACVALQTRILTALTGVNDGIARENKQQDKTDLFTILQKIVGNQRKNLKDSEAAQTAKAGVAEVRQLAKIEDGLANDLITFSDQCQALIEQRVEDEFAAQLRKVYDLFGKKQLYEKMLAAAEALDGADLAAGIQSQEEALRILLEGLNILNMWRMKNAENTVAKVQEVLKATAEKLDKLEQKQAHIAEVTRDLAERGVLDDKVREELAKMDKEQKDMGKIVEEMANDLYQFPEMPVCNELNAKMREIYEDVEQAQESEDAPALEIAVQKEDALLDAIRNTKERIEDVEMWLPDIPDNIVWNMESFDADEFPDMPLVPLPDELEDIVGDLLDQASDIDAQSQDTTGNNMIADMEMGWAVMDGPMPCFSAKGKSGNARPNDNEMTGRSGAGREGQSNGELVENHVKGLEGRETHARRTKDPFQKGQVTEDEGSTLNAKSTGGGKLGGVSETIGMFGKAPRRDLNQPAHGNATAELRQETEALYATARLLYLGTGNLGTAARELRGIENAPQKMKNFGSLHKRVMRQLEDTQVELTSGVVLSMPVSTVTQSGGAATQDVNVNQISEEYREIVSDYYRSLDKE